MIKKRLFGTTIAMLACGLLFAAVPSTTSEAASLTMTSDMRNVKYLNLSDEEIQILKSLFQYEYYKTENHDVAVAWGDTYDIMFYHFVTRGIFEGRDCCPEFNASAYASAYPDLQDKFGDDIYRYYEHYLNKGISEERKYTTIEACVKDNITVTSILDEKVKITPQVYAVAKIMGTTDLSLVNTSIERAVKKAEETGSPALIEGTDDLYVGVEENQNKDDYEGGTDEGVNDEEGYPGYIQTSGLKYGGNNGVRFIIFKGNTEKTYGAYAGTFKEQENSNDNRMNTIKLIWATDGFELDNLTKGYIDTINQNQYIDYNAQISALNSIRQGAAIIAEGYAMMRNDNEWKAETSIAGEPAKPYSVSSTDTNQNIDPLTYSDTHVQTYGGTAPNNNTLAAGISFGYDEQNDAVKVYETIDVNSPSDNVVITYEIKPAT